jgi:D-alanine transaminase
MADVLYFNGRFTSTDEPVISVEDRGFQFGDAVYETIKFQSGALLFGDDHFHRLQQGLAQLEIVNPWTPESFAASMSELLERTSFDSGIVYVQISRGVRERVHFPSGTMVPTVVAYSRRFIFPDEAKKCNGIRLVTVEETRWQYCAIKSVNLLGNVLAKKKAYKAGVDEALFVESGEVIEGASSNFFVVSAGRLVTHPADCSILPGVVRNRVIELAAQQGIALDERVIRQTELDGIAEAFITSTTQAVMPVSEIDGVLVGDGSRGPITRMLQERFEQLEMEQAGKWNNPGVLS